MYHLNPKTGEPGFCRAKVNPCPFGPPEDHYISKDQAREAYEVLMAHLLREPAPTDPRLPIAVENFELSITAQAKRGRALKASMPQDLWDALESYKGVSFHNVNTFLRVGSLRSLANPIYSAEAREARAKELIPQLDRAFSYQVERRRILYRHLSFAYEEARNSYLESFKEGPVKDPAFLSTSAHPGLPLTNALGQESDGRSSLILEIETSHGLELQLDTEIVPGAVQSYEQEVLLPRAIVLTATNYKKTQKYDLNSSAAHHLSKLFYAMKV